MYQISVEHHVRHEILMRGVENWRFLCMQTEEESRRARTASRTS